MIVCAHLNAKRYGKDRYGNQRHRCNNCGKTWIESQPKPLDNLRMPHDRAVMVLRTLLEGVSVRATTRLTGVSKKAILRLLVLVGDRCRYFWQQRMRHIRCEDVQVDEVWGFVGCKEKTRQRDGKPDTMGDAYVFTALDRDTKLLINYHVGKREYFDAEWFCHKLAETIEGRCQVTTDGYKPYSVLMVEAFGYRADFAQLIKIFGKNPGDDRTYSPGTIKRTRRRIVNGNPDEGRISTSHIERSNLTIRTCCRRMTRLTNAFSKKWENHEAALALFFVAYNFVTIHGTLKTTPAVAHGLTNEPWTIDRLLVELASVT